MRFILVTLVLDILGIGIVIPVLPEIVTGMLGGDESRAAFWYGSIAASYALAQFLFAPVLGALSDQIGRRPVLLVSLAGFGVNYVLFGLAPNLAWLFAARVLCGVCGASFTTCNAYIADISKPEDRARNFGLVGAAFGIGFIFGPALGGLLGELGPRVPLFVAAGLAGVNWLYGFFVLPESLPLERRRPFSLKEANPVGGLLRLRRYPFVASLAVSFVLMMMAHRGLETVFVLYTSYRYGWEALQNGLGLGLVGLTAAVVQGGMVRRVVARYGERRTVLIGLTVATAGYAFYGLASAGWMLLAVIVFASLGGLAGPAIQGLVTGTVDPSEQGAIQGTLTSLTSLVSIFAPLISTGLFSALTGEGAPLELPGAPFFAAASFALVALLLIVRTFRVYPAPAPSAEAAPPSA